MGPRSLRLAFAAALACACGSTPRAATYTAIFPPLAPAPMPAPESCDVMPLIAHRDSSGDLTRLYIRVERDGVPGLLTFDTGTPITKLTHDSARQNAEIRGAGHVSLFCDDRLLDSQPQSSLNADGVADGLPVMGTLGVDVLDGGVVEVDAPRQVFIVHPAEWEPGLAGWTRLPIALVRGILVADAVIDGASYRVEFDTGGYRTFLFDRQADMSPPVTSVHDWVGNEVIMKETVGELVLGDGPMRRVVVGRSRRYPVFESWMSSTGIVGAIGISSLGSDHFVIDLGRGELRIAPRR